MKNIRSHLNLNRRETDFDLYRLSEEEYRQLRENSLPIKEDFRFLWQLFISERCNPDRLTLPKALLSLEYLFGKTSTYFDDWKGSFAFPLLVILNKPQGEFFYMLRIYDRRGSLSFSWYRVLENGANDYDINIIRQPFDLEFSHQEMNEFISYFYGYLIGISESAIQLRQRSFLKQIDSNWIIYGSRAGELFEEEFNSQEDYQQAITTFKQTYSCETIADKSIEIQLLLQAIRSS